MSNFNTGPATMARKRKSAIKRVRDAIAYAEPEHLDAAAEAFLADLLAKAPPLSEDTLALVAKLLPPVELGHGVGVAGVAGPTRTRPEVVG